MLETLKNYQYIFLDFDGVIKESVSVKTESFVELFKFSDEKTLQKIREHHLNNGGMSRFEKIPIYLQWAKKDYSSYDIRKFCDKFGEIAKDKVINSDWVPGVYEFLEKNKENFVFILVSATPQDEIEDICDSLSISSYFSAIFGSPKSKTSIIKNFIIHSKININKCVLIGDATADFDAANNTGIDFIYRNHEFNKDILIQSNVKTIVNFL